MKREDKNVDSSLDIFENLYIKTVVLKLCVATPRSVVQFFKCVAEYFGFVPLSLGFIASKEL